MCINWETYDWCVWRQAVDESWWLEVDIHHEKTLDAINSTTQQAWPLIWKVAHHTPSLQKLAILSSHQITPKTYFWRPKLLRINLAQVQFGNRLLNSRPEKQGFQLFLKLFWGHRRQLKAQRQNPKNHQLRLWLRLMFIRLKPRTMCERQPSTLILLTLPFSVTKLPRSQENLPETLNSLSGLSPTEYSPQSHKGVPLRLTIIISCRKKDWSAVDKEEQGKDTVYGGDHWCLYRVFERD